MGNKIIAIDPYNGWYFVEKKEKIFLLRPPYTGSFQVLASKYEVEKAIAQYNFRECDIRFKSINDTIKFAKEEYIKIKKAQGINIPSNEQLIELLNYATDEILWEYLRKAKNELIPNGKFKIAKSIARDFLKLEKVNNNPAMKKMVWDIVEKCQQYDEKHISKNDFAGIKVIGLGGSGTNVIKEMSIENIKGVKLIALDTDFDSPLLVNQGIQIVRLTSGGLETTGNVKIGEKRAKEDIDKIFKVMEKTDIAFIVTCLGGGIGTGISPIVAGIAKKGGAFTIGIVTTPFIFEGKVRTIKAGEGIKKLRDQTDILINISNNNLLKTMNKDTSLMDAFKLIDKTLCQVVKAITDLITNPGLINIDISDLMNVLGGGGLAVVGIGIGKGREKAYTAAKMAITSPLLEGSIKGARSLLVNITGSIDMSLIEVNKIVNIISRAVDEDTDIAFGAIIDENMKDEVKVSLIVRFKEMKKKEKKNKTYFKKDGLHLEIPSFFNKKI